MNITPSGFPIIAADIKTAVFTVSLPESDFYSLSPGQSGQISLKNGFRFDSTIIFLSPQSERGYSNFAVHFRLPPLDLSNFRLGTSGIVTI